MTELGDNIKCLKARGLDTLRVLTSDSVSREFLHLVGRRQTRMEQMRYDTVAKWLGARRDRVDTTWRTISQTSAHFKDRILRGGLF
jgi:hypothetical protein